MRAMVMAAGAGTRLRPLTSSVPKPMVPVANRPVLEYTIENLRRHGITEMVLNLHSHPQMIRKHFKNGERWGVDIRYSDEPRLLGTAGGVKKVASFLKGGTFLVMSGDGLTDINLTRLLAFHQERRSKGTIALKRIDTRFDYGVTITGRDGRIKQFIEKPKWSDVFSNQVNTGIYVFEPSTLNQIPAGKVYDFGHELWPKLLKQRSPIFGHEVESYWCDIGSLPEYRRAQRDILDGLVDLPFPGRPLRRNVWVEEGTELGPRVKIDAPVLIGKQCRIGAGTRIGDHSIIGHRARIGKNVTLRSCILWNDVRVEDGATLENCILGHGARVSKNASVYEGVVT